MFKLKHLPIHLIIVALTASYFLGYTPLLLSVLFFTFSVLAYGAYAKDKSAARNGQWRVSEKTLHVLALLCGWPGAILAQQRLRHKTQKRSFRVVFWLTLLLNLGAVASLHSVEGSKHLHRCLSTLQDFAVNTIGSNDGTRALLILTRLRP